MNGKSPQAVPLLLFLPGELGRIALLGRHYWMPFGSSLMADWGQVPGVVQASQRGVQFLSVPRLKKTLRMPTPAVSGPAVAAGHPTHGADRS